MRGGNQAAGEAGAPSRRCRPPAPRRSSSPSGQGRGSRLASRVRSAGAAGAGPRTRSCRRGCGLATGPGTGPGRSCTSHRRGSRRAPRDRGRKKRAAHRPPPRSRHAALLRRSRPGARKEPLRPGRCGGSASCQAHVPIVPFGLRAEAVTTAGASCLPQILPRRLRFSCCSISSRLRPFVSGTRVAKKISARTPRMA
jgi:hypothetical protein